MAGGLAGTKIKEDRVSLNVRTRTIGLVLLSVALAGAQITITPGEIPQTPGDTFTWKYTITTAPVNVGTQGGPQTWTFDTASYIGDIAACKLVDPAGTPFIQFFPEANITWLSLPEGSNDQSYAYLRASSSDYTEFGTAFASPETSTFQVWDPSMLVFPLPLNNGDQWQTDWGWCDTMEEMVISLHTWGRHMVDAWGTANLPFRSVPCLRVNGYDSTITMTWIGGVLINSDTFGIRVYAWYAENLGYVAVATGAENDTSLVFTESDCYRVMIDGTYGIAEQNEVSQASSLRILPNPFTKTAHVSFVTRRPEVGTVRIFDRAGNLIRVLTDGTRRTGRHSVVWDGRNAAGNRAMPGVYFCSVTADGAASSRKLVLSD
jgi:hypothetical protein